MGSGLYDEEKNLCSCPKSNPGSLVELMTSRNNIGSVICRKRKRSIVLVLQVAQ
jgi:hypothetical protein